MLNATTLKTAVVTKMEAIAPGSVTDDRLLQALCEAVVEHIQTSAVVSVISVSGVTPGPGVSGVGTGTIS